MDQGIVLLNEAVEGVFEAAEPAALARMHPAWAREVRELGRPEAVELPLASGGSLSGLVWPGYPAPARVFVCGECASTMDAARWLAAEEALGPWDAVLAARQLQGRGQLRREWTSPAGNLYASLCWPGPPGAGFAAAAWAQLTPLVAGWMLAKGLGELGVPLAIKWPNDLLWGEAKVGGLLAEERRGATVVGVGLNLASAPDASRLRADGAVPAAALAQAGLDLPPLALWTRLVKYGQFCYTEFLHKAGSRDFIQRFNRWLAWTGRPVTVHEGSRPPFQATVLGAADDGGLRLVREGLELTLYSGSVTPAGPDNAPRAPAG
jgi:BirA family biotin operon repressor/biotin-[acetyl-CoA-carboxylase] ligase